MAGPALVVRRTGPTVASPLPDAHFDATRNGRWCARCCRTRTSRCSGSSCKTLAALLIEEADVKTRRPNWWRARGKSSPADGFAAARRPHARARVLDPGDPQFGCIDKGPKRWLKKHWKYMRAAESLPGGTVGSRPARGPVPRAIDRLAGRKQGHRIAYGMAETRSVVHRRRVDAERFPSDLASPPALSAVVPPEQTDSCLSIEYNLFSRLHLVS